jgi:putative hydrolase of the HAD superfamily
MLAWVDRLRSAGLRVVLMSDQTNWLEEIDRQQGLYRRFDAIINSYRYGKSKRDATLFLDACAELDTSPANTLFIDDNAQHIERAAGKGLRTLLFTNEEDFARLIAPLIERTP